jgi:hypothetical protein
VRGDNDKVLIMKNSEQSAIASADVVATSQPVKADVRRYVICDGWGHLFGIGFPESTVRFVYDNVNSVIVDMHIETSLGWVQASKIQMDDVAESVHDNLDWGSGKSVEEQLSEMVNNVTSSDELPDLGAGDQGEEDQTAH